MWGRRVGVDSTLPLRRLRGADGRRLHDLTRPLARAVYVGEGEVLCRVLGRYNMYVDARDVGFGAHLIMNGVWEGGLTVFLARRLRAGMAVVDAGANQGYYTLLAAELAGAAGRVAAVEPAPATVERLRRNVFVNGLGARVEVLACALGDADEVALRLHTPDGEPKNARLVAPEVATPADAVVAGARLETLLGHWPRVDLIKMDVEGAEERALAGAWSLLARDRPDLVLEFNPGRCDDPAALLARLEALYGPARRIADHGGEAVPAPRDALLDRSDAEDRLLWFSHAR